jgi:hypothetical protein
MVDVHRADGSDLPCCSQGLYGSSDPTETRYIIHDKNSGSNLHHQLSFKYVHCIKRPAEIVWH